MDLTNELLKRTQRRDNLYFGVLDGVDTGDDKPAEEDAAKEPFPFKLVTLLVLIIVLFAAVGNRNTAMSHLTPMLNVAGILFFMGYSLHVLRN